MEFMAPASKFSYLASLLVKELAKDWKSEIFPFLLKQ